MKETIKAHRVTYLVDDDTWAFLSKAHGYSESNEMWIWENTEDVVVEVESCDVCGTYFYDEFEYVLTDGKCEWCYEEQE